VLRDEVQIVMPSTVKRTLAEFAHEAQHVERFRFRD